MTTGVVPLPTEHPQRLNALLAVITLVIAGIVRLALVPVCICRHRRRWRCVPGNVFIAQRRIDPVPAETWLQSMTLLVRRGCSRRRLPHCRSPSSFAAATVGRLPTMQWKVFRRMVMLQSRQTNPYVAVCSVCTSTNARKTCTAAMTACVNLNRAS